MEIFDVSKIKKCGEHTFTIRLLPNLAEHHLGKYSLKYILERPKCVSFALINDVFCLFIHSSEDKLLIDDESFNLASNCAFRVKITVFRDGLDKHHNTIRVVDKIYNNKYEYRSTTDKYNTLMDIYAQNKVTEKTLTNYVLSDIYINKDVGILGQFGISNTGQTVWEYYISVIPEELTIYEREQKIKLFTNNFENID